MSFTISIFDTNIEDYSFKIWAKPQDKFPKKFLNDCYSFKGLKSKNGSKNFAERFFFLKENYLLYKKKEEGRSQYSAVLDLNWVRVEYQGRRGGNGEGLVEIRFIRNLKFSSILVEKGVFDQLRNRFRRYCVLVDFKEVYQPLDLIERGSYASVFLVKKIISGETFAVKRFSKKDLTHDKIDIIQTLKREIETLRRLDHESIVKIVEVQETQNSVYIVFEHLDAGRIIPTRSSRPESKISEIRKILFSILDVIKYLKSKKIVHRDIKPENILFRKKRSADVKIIDFGLAVSLHEDTGRISGTPGFLAPELFSSNSRNDFIMNSKVDIFSVGVILHYYLFRKWVFQGKNLEEVFERNCEGKVEVPNPDDIKTDEKDLDAYDLVKLMLMVDQDERVSVEEALSHPFFRPLRQNQDADQRIDEEWNIGKENFLDEDHLGFADFAFLGSGMRDSGFISGLKERFEV